MKSLRRDHSALANALPYIAGVIVAVAIKYYYSRSSPDDLLWILYPTSFLVGRISSLHFVFVPHVGFVDHASGIAIVQACAGLNFLAILFCTLFFPFLRYRASGAARWGWLLAVLASSYALTLVVNSIRIVVAVFLSQQGMHYGWLTAARVHRIEGLIVYFLSLTAIYFLAQKIFTTPTVPDLPGVAGRHGLIRRVPAPFFWYVLVAAVIPAIDSTFRRASPGLPEHFSTVIILASVLYPAVALAGLYFSHVPFKIGEKPCRKGKEG